MGEKDYRRAQNALDKVNTSTTAGKNEEAYWKRERNKNR